MNPILNQMMNFSLANNPIVQMFKMVMGANNKTNTLQSLAQNNPQMQKTLEFINQNGGNAQQLYYNMCKQKNVDPNIIINQLNNMQG
jgi:hypothetical protein